MTAGLAIAVIALNIVLSPFGVANEAKTETLAPKKPAQGSIPLIFDSSTIGARLGPMRVLVEKSKAGYKLGGVLLESERFTWDFQQASLRLDFDPTIFKPQLVFIMSESGEVLNITDLEQSHLQIDKSLEIKNRSAKKDELAKGVVDVSISQKALPKLNNSRVCISEEEWDGLISYCSGLLNDKPTSSSDDQILVNGLKVVDKGEVVLKDNEDLQFLIQLKDSGFIKGVYRVTPSTLRQVYQTAPGEIAISFFSTPPAIPHRLLTRKRSPIFEATIGDLRKVHEVKVPESLPFVHFKASKGMIFSQRVYFNFLPTEDERVWLMPESATSTYSTSIKLNGQLGKHKKESINDSDVKITNDKFSWTYKSPVIADFNTDSIVTQVTRNDGKDVHQLGHIHEVYRGRSTYLSARTGIAAGTDASVGFTGELSLQHWFERIAGSSPLLSHQRWGTKANFVQSYGADVEFNQAQIELLYRFSRGVENWNETTGLSVGFNQFNVDTATYQWMGPTVGMFWNRSAPPWFDRITEFLPFFRRPKWVNFSATIFTGSLSENIVDAYGFQVAALGRVELSKSTFLEGGWAITGVSYISTSNGEIVADGSDVLELITIAYGRGYLGVGARF
jgi:hypothetical protein